VPDNTIHLAMFRFVSRHTVNMLSGVYLAASIAAAIGKFVPDLRVAAFIVLSISWMLTGIAVIVREAQGNRKSLAVLGIGGLPPVIVGSAIILLIARIIAHYEPAPAFSILIAEWGLMFWVGGYLVMMRNAYHDKKLEEDLAKKPKEASNQTMQPTAGPFTASLSDD